MGSALGLFLAPRVVIPTVRIISAGSTTIYPLSQKWAGEYQAVFPSVQVQVSAGGSGLGQTNVAEGIVDIGASSSYPSSSYRSANPTVKIIPIAADALAVIGHSAVNGTAGLKLTRDTPAEGPQVESADQPGRSRGGQRPDLRAFRWVSGHASQCTGRRGETQRFRVEMRNECW